VSTIADLLAWLQRGLQGLGGAISLRVREEPVLRVGLFRAAITMLVGFGLGWTGEQVALMVALTPLSRPGSVGGRPRRRRTHRCRKARPCGCPTGPRRRLAKRTVVEHVARHGWTCPGWHREPHSGRPGVLAADHPVPLVLGGGPLPAEPGGLCSSCNARRALSQRRR